MEIRGENLTAEKLEGLKSVYPAAVFDGQKAEISANELEFDLIVDHLRRAGVKIQWLTMKQPSLDDVFLSLTEEENTQ